MKTFLLFLASLCTAVAAVPTDHNVRNVVVFQPQGDGYAGWPANYGIWGWGDDIVLGFTTGFHDSTGYFHAVTKTRPFITVQSRSLDGGLTWTTGPIPAHTPGGRGLSVDEHMVPDLWMANVVKGAEAPVQSPGDVDFTNPNFAMMCARTGLTTGAVSFFYTSIDRCKSWQGPYALPSFGLPGLAARTDYLVSGPKELTLFLTAAKSNGDEGHVFCARTMDGGKTFKFLSWLGEEPVGYQIMPASVRLSPSRILTAVRVHIPVPDNKLGHSWIDLYASDDNGASFKKLPSPVLNTGPAGSPPTLTKLIDGRLCLVYGYREKPYGIRAKLSSDQGATWGDEIVLRSDGGGPDLGYPRTYQKPDGTLVTCYYYNNLQGGAAYIAATLWKP